MTGKELIALSAELASDAAIGLVPLASLRKSEEENRSALSTIGHFAAATGVTIGLDKASDIASKKILGVTGGEVLRDQVLKKMMTQATKSI